MDITAAQRLYCRFCRHYSCMAMSSADKLEYCSVSVVSLNERVKFTWQMTFLKSTSCSDEKCLQKLFHMWYGIPCPLSQRHHSDGVRCKNLVRLEIQVEAIICFILSSLDKFPHVCATVGAPFSKLFIPVAPDWDLKRVQHLFFSTV